MVDVICYLCKDENLSSPSSALKSPVSVLLPKLPGLVRHVEPSCRLLDDRYDNKSMDENNYNTKISDFGLAKLGPSGGESHVTTRVMGTYGYAAPEYVATGHLYVKSDVYGFGVVLLEMLTVANYNLVGCKCLALALVIYHVLRCLMVMEEIEDKETRLQTAPIFYMLLVLSCSAGMAARLFVEQLCYCTALSPSVPAAAFCAAEILGCYNFCYSPYGCLYLDCCRIWVVDALEIFTVIGKIPHLLGFLNSLYDCQYNWPNGANKIGPLFASPLLVYMREVRTVVYSQFLESYESVTIEAMAKALEELSRFIAAGKLHCKIDKVAGVLETNRPDAKNALYQATIKQGDFLLNRIQKLSRVIDL
ncbi:hypothetical protein HYC85_000511 [Camellia sinensis]|uniref:Protein kinase domain-containing protein n=1 Tax=Camellia sinensis TaxID=4442 RepID=A0A7J7I2P7_CAMSI|nr:hypothetical protein HYC85_000511 [Camellia sinensis]